MSDGYAYRMPMLVVLAILALLTITATADAHRPTKRAAANDAQYAGETRARYDHGVILQPGGKVIYNRRATRHTRRVEVVVPLEHGAVLYCMRVSHSHRVLRLRECGRTL